MNKSLRVILAVTAVAAGAVSAAQAQGYYYPKEPYGYYQNHAPKDRAERYYRPGHPYAYGYNPYQPYYGQPGWCPPGYNNFAGNCEWGGGVGCPPGYNAYHGRCLRNY